ncbi:MAG: hypothetical protein ACE5FA_04930, partial [Dehalococcoidia bacterium]
KLKIGSMPDDIETPAPVHLRDVDADHIKRFAERMKTFWANQDNLDPAFSDIDKMRPAIEVATNKNDPKPVTFRTGILGRQNKKEASVLNILPFAHFNPTDREDPKAVALANLLESWAAGAAQRSMKTGNTQRVIPDKGVRFGRAWEETIVDPSVWATPEFKEMAERIAAMDKGSAAEAEEKLAMMKRDNWPVMTREVETRGTWTYFSGKVWLPEVIQIRQMTRDEIDAEGWALPTEHANRRDSTKIEVLYYTNHRYAKTVISGKIPTITHSFKHDLGMNPVYLGEFVRAPENDMNIRWQPSMYHAKEMAEALDEALSDWRTAQRETTRAQIGMFFDKTEYDEDQMVNGRPKEVTIEPGGPMIPFWLGEKVERIPGPVMNEQATMYLNFVYGAVREEVKRPTQEGDFKSGTSNNLAVTASQLAERDFDPMVAALRQMWLAKTKLLMRSVVRINAEFPSFPDNLAVYDPNVTGEGFLEVGPDDVIGMEAGIQIRAERAIPIDKNLLLSQARQEKELELPPEVYMGATLGHEDVPALVRAANRHAGKQALFKEVLMPLVIERTVTLAQRLSPQEQAELEKLATGASGGLLQAIGLNPQSAAVPGSQAAVAAATNGATGRSTGQSAANVGRTAVPQNPQGLV